MMERGRLHFAIADFSSHAHFQRRQFFWSQFRVWLEAIQCARVQLPQRRKACTLTRTAMQQCLAAVQCGGDTNAATYVVQRFLAWLATSGLGGFRAIERSANA